MSNIGTVRIKSITKRQLIDALLAATDVPDDATLMFYDNRYGPVIAQSVLFEDGRMIAFEEPQHKAARTICEAQ